MSFCKDCISGVRHEGSPGGTYEEINGIKTYVATPSTDYPKDKALLYVADIFGYELPNNTLLADDFARNGFKVYFPDLFEGDPAPADALNPGSNFDLYKWLANHKPEHTVKRVRRVVEGLKEQGIAVYGATGYCYGARLVFDLAFDNVIQTAVVAHPSLVQSDELDTYLEKSKAALLINSCEFDDLFPPSLAKTADEKFSKFAPGYRRTYFEGVRHGFAVRGDPNSPVVNAAKEGAFKASVEWLLKYLK
ncbi:chlorocatechol-degradation protein [Russula earlei]|uniref:Chlorocatechol-degradation protein n=1 Tax=Russula earlei TaxID=71964 RepID=A0ACC0TZB8_9AGAM|nr:chlorocatechol-degradation protein [Russula earlei]